MAKILEIYSINNNNIPVVPPIPGGICKVSMKCHSGLVMELRGKCENKATFEKVYNLWTKVSKQKNCQKPIIKDLSFSNDEHETFLITCVALGVPAPNITLIHNNTQQQLTVTGLEERNTTSVIQVKVMEGVYICKASNYVGESVEIWQEVINDTDNSIDVNVSSNFWLNSTGLFPLFFHKTNETCIIMH